ncbi:MAG: HIT domain-containing protein [Acidobacteria bacterium]|nr:HIT domain-containing protein [Acidobacteriota bacterium]
MNQLYAPWRHAWVTGDGSAPEPAGCLFCGVWSRPEQDAEQLVVHRGELCLVMLNRYPYNAAHLMIAPREHRGSLELLAAPARAEMMELSARSLGVLRALYQPHGFNLGVNEGRSAGAGIPEHVHLHVVPRWNGDTNFMTTVGATRVISTDLALAREQIANAFAGAP